MNKPKQNIWFHGTREKFSGDLRPMYLTPSKALASMHGKIYQFKIDDDAKWLNIDQVEHFIPSMDSIGYVEGWAEKLRKKGWDVVWDKPDYLRGYKQIYVANPDVLKPIENIDEAANLNQLLKTLFEEISPSVRKEIETADPNDIITVYHGTPKMRIPDLINGFDATQVVPRDYGGGAHRGLFVTPDPEVAKNFGGGAVFELKVPAKFIHGTDWGGLTGRDIKREKGKGALDWVKDKFPNSFRPWMSYTMLSSGTEPQGILIGTVKPSQITRIWVRDLKSNKWKEYTRKEYLDTKDYYNVRRVLDKNKYEYIHDAGIHLANPKLKLEDFTKALADFEGGYEAERYIDLFIKSYERDPDRLIEMLKSIEIGGSRLGALALKSIIKQIKQKVDELNN